MRYWWSSGHQRWEERKQYINNTGLARGPDWCWDASLERELTFSKVLSIFFCKDTPHYYCISRLLPLNVARAFRTTLWTHVVSAQLIRSVVLYCCIWILCCICKLFVKHFGRFGFRTTRDVGWQIFMKRRSAGSREVLLTTMTYLVWSQSGAKPGQRARCDHWSRHSP